MSQTKRHIEQLASDYRRVGASPWLTIRVMAQLDTRPVRRNWRWLPIAVVGTVVAVAILLAPGLLQQTQRPTHLAMSLPPVPVTPSLPVSGLIIKTPSMSQLGKLPVLPQTPGDKRVAKSPQST